MTQLPIYDTTAPIQCTIDPGDIADRIELLERLRNRLIAVERTAHGLLLRFPPGPGIEADVRGFAVDEKQCCRFWGFDVSASEQTLTLRWDGPPAANDILDRLLESLRGDDPISEIAGLL
jgi:hypothetical protein